MNDVLFGEIGFVTPKTHFATLNGCDEVWFWSSKSEFFSFCAKYFLPHQIKATFSATERMHIHIRTHTNTHVHIHELNTDMHTCTHTHSQHEYTHIQTEIRMHGNIYALYLPHEHTHQHSHAYSKANTRTYTLSHVRKHAHIRTHAHTQVHTHTCIHACMHVYRHARMCYNKNLCLLCFFVSICNWQLIIKMKMEIIKLSNRLL